MMKTSLPEMYLIDRKSKSFGNIILQSPPCQSAEPWKLMTLISSSRSNWINRELFRIYHQAHSILARTGSTEAKPEVPLMFLIGTKPDGENRHDTILLDAEIEKYKDFIVGNYTDIYSNLPFKTLSAYEYVAECEDILPSRIVLQDDDSFLDLEKATRFNFGNISCFNGAYRYYRPHRYGKYKISISDWPSGYYFPDYCSGPCTGIDKQTMLAIYKQGMLLKT